EALAHLWDVHAHPGLMPVLLRLGNRRHAVVRAEGDDVAVAANTLVQVLEQLADPAVQSYEQILDLTALGSEGVADAIESRETDGEEVGDLAPSQLEVVGQRRGHPREVRVRERALPPQCDEPRVRRALPGNRMWKCTAPSVGGALRGDVVGKAIRVLRSLKRPGATEVGFERVARDEGLDGRHGAFRKRA